MGPVAASTKHAEFLALVKDLRALGATRVRSGDLEAAFAGVQPATPEERSSGKMERVSLTTVEHEELAELRAMRGRAEELGVDI